ncbi:unnamed protein product [Phaeothamnion confervicola]
MVSSCELGAGSVTGSVLSGVRCNYIEAEGAILVNVTAKRVVAPPGSVIYNMTDTSDTGLCVAADGVLVGVHADDGSQRCVWSAGEIDGGKAWKVAVKGNGVSFEDIYEANADADVAAAEAARTVAADTAWDKIAVSNGKQHA